MIVVSFAGDVMVRQIHDVKGIDMGNGVIRYKAEVDVDGRALAQYYLSKRNLDVMLYEVQRIKTKPGTVTDIILFCLRFDGVFREDTTLFHSKFRKSQGFANSSW